MMCSRQSASICSDTGMPSSCAAVTWENANGQRDAAAKARARSSRSRGGSVVRTPWVGRQRSSPRRRSSLMPRRSASRTAKGLANSAGGNDDGSTCRPSRTAEGTTRELRRAGDEPGSPVRGVENPVRGPSTVQEGGRRPGLWPFDGSRGRAEARFVAFRRLGEGKGLGEGLGKGGVVVGQQTD